MFLRSWGFVHNPWLFCSQTRVLGFEGRFIVEFGNNKKKKSCNKVKGLHYQNEMCSLMISAVIYLMVKGDATDETFTRNIILGKKNQSTSQPPAGCAASLVPHRLRQSPGRVPIDVMETLKLRESDSCLCWSLILPLTNRSRFLTLTTCNLQWVYFCIWINIF